MRVGVLILPEDHWVARGRWCGAARLGFAWSTTSPPPFVMSACERASIGRHGEDGRRPLGLHREVPVATLLVAAEILEDDCATGTPERIEGTCLTATGVDWSTDDGPIVGRPLRSVVLALAGRGDALDELSGDGLAQLRAKIGAV